MLYLYYTPPEDKYFNELKRKAIEIWLTYDDTYKYASGKINQIKDIENVSDNFMYILGMFDHHNQRRLAHELSSETKKEIHDRIIDGGGFDEVFIN